MPELVLEVGPAQPVDRQVPQERVSDRQQRTQQVLALVQLLYQNVLPGQLRMRQQTMLSHASSLA